MRLVKNAVVFSLVMVICMCYFLDSNVYSNQPTNIIVSHASANPGETVTIKVKLENVVDTGITSAYLFVSYDPSNFDFEKSMLRAGDIINDPLRDISVAKEELERDNEPTINVIAIAYSDYNQLGDTHIKEDGVFCEIDFTVKPGVPDGIYDIEINTYLNMLYNSQMFYTNTTEKVDTGFIYPGSIKVPYDENYTGSGVSPTPSPSPTPTRSPEATKMPGNTTTQTPTPTGAQSPSPTQEPQTTPSPTQEPQTTHSPTKEAETTPSPTPVTSSGTNPTNTPAQTPNTSPAKSSDIPASISTEKRRIADARFVGKKIITLYIGYVFLNINGEQMYIDKYDKKIAPIIENDRTIVPVRAVVTALDGRIGWKGSEKKITIEVDNKKIEMWIGMKKSVVNGQERENTVEPVVINDRAFLPLRFIAENVGCIVEWDSNEQKITLIK